ncbi:(2,3-dihydroxybenzoyl)adenylate synthase [Actinomadura opuntiae]|uniref:(2,3-dihydroxybenzoyl)adenylate synthase n=1 Tax=Actinomadura sp. OS1-43 TaxID=604315 RepID=UPI00255A9F40|nr:AMP-binding protein [Actinomadura sp. OS1-43]MDL4820234.1 AMP-binding protein [Actinomadura sp. OS1-43]
MTSAPMSVDEGFVPWPADVAARYTEAGLWHGVPLGTRLRAAADAQPEETALVEGAVRLTYGDLWERADGAARRLDGLGLRRGDKILVQLPNRWEFVVLTLACLRLGVVPVMALPSHRRHELGQIAEQAEAAAIAVPRTLRGFDHEGMAHEIAAACGTVRHVLVAGGPTRPGSADLGDLCAPASAPDAARAALDADPPDPRAPALFLLSGGTTGTPKLIPRTHDDYGCGMDHAIAACRFGPGTVFLAAMPVAHNFTLGGPGVLGALLAGGRAVLAASPDPAVVFPVIERERVTDTGVVPAVALRWVEHREAGDRRDLSSLRALQIGGARPPGDLVRRIRPVLGCTPQQGYGMAEGLICFTRQGDPDEVVSGTQGRPICPADELLVVGEDGRPVPPGEPGILLTRGPSTPRGYYRAPEHNARAFTPDGWYITGDIVRLRPDGYLVVAGRDKDMINRGGEKVSAEEVEDLAHRVAGVAQAAAVAMPDAVLGERVCLYAVPRPGARVRLEDVVAEMERAGAARYKLPERLVLVDALPLTPVGKIDKKALRDDVRRRVSLDGTSRPAGA